MALWNFGFYRTEFTDSADNARREYAAPNPYNHVPTKADDIYACAMLFLSLAFAAASPPHIEHRFGPGGFAACVTKFRKSRRNGVVPNMPELFRKLPGFSPHGGEQLWRLIVDMVEANVKSSVTMDVVTSRLRVIIEL